MDVDHLRRRRADQRGPRVPRAAADDGAGWMDAAMSASFVVLLVGAMARFLIRHPGAAETPWVVALTAVLAVVYVLRPGVGGRPLPPWTRLWLAGFVCGWTALVVLAPSFAWSAVPIVYTALRVLSERAALVLIGLLTVLVVVAQVRISGADPLLILGPPAVAGLASVVFLHMQHQSARQRSLIDDLIRTREGLAASERRAGTLAERERLSMEIHDTLAQGLSSQRMLLQAADRVWDADPGAARRHVATASGIAERNLAEARRFVHDLAPADLAEGGGLEEALRTLAERESEVPRGSGAVGPAGPAGPAGPGSDSAAGSDDADRSDRPDDAEDRAGAEGSEDRGLRVRFATDGRPVPLPAAVEAALLRVAQGAVANIREHADAAEATITLSYLDDQLVLDIADNGKGFTLSGGPGAPRPSGAAASGAGAASDRGHGLRAMAARLRQLAGTLTVESAPGEGTVVSASVPLTRGADGGPGTAHTAGPTSDSSAIDGADPTTTDTAPDEKE